MLFFNLWAGLFEGKVNKIISADNQHSNLELFKLIHFAYYGINIS